jgi:nanoRNase/pAp phosphatase (c-di-AMP/oligoRNAs hydrolase)
VDNEKGRPDVLGPISGVDPTMSEDKKFRLVTRSDFDGLVCAVLLKELDLIEDIKFVHPKDMQDGTILITDNDITTNLPYVPGCHLAFDHHLSETIRMEEKPENHIIDPDAPSAARVVYDHYGGKAAFPNVGDDIMEAVDKGDAAQFTVDEITHPTGWPLLNYLMDSRTGLGRFREFRISNYQLMMQLIDYCRNHSIEEILELPDVKERVDLYFEQEAKFKEQIERCTTVHKNLAVLDLREEETIYAGNRFMIYAMYPDTNVSIHVLWGLNKLNTVFATGASIVNRTSKTNIGELMLKYGGGGHENAGTCQVENDQAEKVLGELIEHITANG